MRLQKISLTETFADFLETFAQTRGVVLNMRLQKFPQTESFAGFAQTCWSGDHSTCLQKNP